ncbi:MAG: hypothetical protein K2X90_03260 [Candidatus Babeliaceae bacterium]|nr:hypothetical protein [Candidatus Babeliaceae bacterium]
MFYETKGPTSNNVSWSNKELEEWEKLGLIPCDFLLPENISQLIKFIIENKELLYAAYHDPIEDYPHLVELPAPERLHETYELRVIDKRTGEVVKILDRMETFEICDDVSLHIKSAEKNPWEEKIASVKKLTKDQKNYLKDVLSKLSDNGQKQININDLVQAIEEIIKETKTATYSVSGKFVDQKVPTQQRLLLQQIDKKTEIKVYGIRRLSPSEHRITKTISLLLHKNNSQGCGPKIEGFAGLDTGKLLKNELLQKVYGSPPSIIMIDEDEYFEAYWGNTEYGGSDRNFMTTGLKDFSRREFPVNVDHIYQINGQELTDRLELSSSMAEVYYFYPSLTTEEKKKLNKGNSKTRRPKRK